MLQGHQRIALTGVILLAVCCAGIARAEPPPPPCHPNPDAVAYAAAVATRVDVVYLPTPLKDRLVQLVDRPHTNRTNYVFALADNSHPLVQNYSVATTLFV